MKTAKLTSAELGRLSKKPTDSARRQGEARLMLDDMVYRAERKLSEAQRKALGDQDPEARAESLAKELYHKPGSMLSSEEIALMTMECGCSEVRETPICTSPMKWLYRTIDGTCNNLENPLFGASETEFTRMTPPFYEDGIDALRGDIQGRAEDLIPIDSFVPPNPSARFISKTIINRNLTFEEEDFTHLLMQWGQFLDHDLDLSPELEEECEHCEFTEICRPIRVPREDHFFGVGTPQDGDCLPFRRSLPVCPTDPPGSFSPREQLNLLTSFIDGSQIYGSNEEVGMAVRKFEDGLLLEGPPAQLDQKPGLPIDRDNIVACLNNVDCRLAGDIRANEQISLTIIHTLWFREHNRLACELKKINPFWNDERLFQEARKIVGALLQKITYDDYLPKVLGPTTFSQLIGDYPGYDPRVNPGVANGFATAAYRYGHSLVRPEFARLGPDFEPLPQGPLKLVDAFFSPEQFIESGGTDPIVRGWLVERVQRSDSNINFPLRTQLFERANEGIIGMDLASLNIQRGRDHGLPVLSVWTNFCNRVFPFLPLGGVFTKELDTLRFLQLHGSLTDVDLWIGGLAEERLPDSFIGPTFACIFGLTFDNVRNGDRFWYENDRVFTPAQLREIKKGTMSRVICDNSDGINDVQPDAFLSNQTRVPCSQIPSLNLQVWREPGCFARLQIVPIFSPVEVSLFSRALDFTSLASSFTQVFKPMRENQFQCAQVACPSRRRGTVVLVESNMPMAVQMMPNDNLPDNKFPTNNRYWAIWPRRAFQQEEYGLFRSQSACENSESVAISISVGADAQQDEMDQGEVEPDVVEKEMKILFGDKEEEEKEAMSPEIVDMAEMESEQDLMTELEEALQDLAL